MRVNYNKIKRVITWHFGSIRTFCDSVGVSRTYFYYVMHRDIKTPAEKKLIDLICEKCMIKRNEIEMEDK